MSHSEDVLGLDIVQWVEYSVARTSSPLDHFFVLEFLGFNTSHLTPKGLYYSSSVLITATNSELSSDLIKLQCFLQREIVGLLT